MRTRTAAGWRAFALGKRAREGAGLAEWALLLSWAWGAELCVGGRRVWPGGGGGREGAGGTAAARQDGDGNGEKGLVEE